MSDNCHSAFEDSEDSSKLCYDNFPHYEGIKKEVKEQLVIVTTNKDFGRLLTLLIPSTTNLLLLLYASGEDFLSTARFCSGRPETRYADAEAAGWSSWGFSSEILRASGKHDDFASIVDELWRPSPFGESLIPVTDGCPQPLSPTAPTEPLSPAGTDDVPEHTDESAGVIGDPRVIRLLKGAVTEEGTPYVGPHAWHTASYADVAAGRQPATLPVGTTATESTASSPRGLVLADFITPKYKKKGRSRKGSSKQNSKTVETLATTDNQLSTSSCTLSADEAAGDAVKSQEANGDDSLAEPEVALRSWPPSPPPRPHSAFCWPNESLLGRGSWSAAVFASKVAQLEEAGKWFAERLAVGELQPDPAALFFELQQLQQKERDFH